MKATQVASVLDTIDIESLPADAQRSLAQRMNAWVKQYNVNPKRKEKSMPKPKVNAPARAIKQDAPLTKAQLRSVAEMLGIIVPGEDKPRPVTRTRTRTTTKAKPKRNTFYEDVIVGNYEKRAEAKPYKCEAKGCYKYGHRFTKAGWFGTKTARGHVDLASRYHK